MTSAPTPSRRVASLTPLRSAGRATPDRVRVRFDDGEELDVALDVAERLGLRSGDPVDDKLRAELAEQDLHWRARDAALTLLDYRARSRSELAGRLARKGFPGGVIARCLDDLESGGLVDDAAFARAFVSDRLALRPRGKRRLISELRGKGVSEGVARSAVDEAFDGLEADEGALAEEVALTWLRKQGAATRRALAAAPFSDPRERARRRLVGHLARRGFAGAAAARAVEAVQRAVEGA